ncbi:ATP-binding protein [Peribacillus sp. NPDC096379]|uniref:ATP-binding protein n=1 Tax=Peribacillus sp. NPDC096379 TaxID=3364393 RepID=UPI003826E7B1
MATRSVEDVLTKLLQRTKNPSPATKSVGLEEAQPNCPICQDHGIIIYRVHEETKWVTNHQIMNGVEVTTLTPETMVLEEDFLSGQVCSPDQAWAWRTTFSKRCACIKQKKMERLLKASDITDEFKKLGFKNFSLEGKPQIIVDMYDCSSSYLKRFLAIRTDRANSIALLGQPGSGKTHLLTAIANNLMQRKNISVLYFPYVEGFNDLKDDFEKLATKLARMRQVDVLFIDDLFKPLKGEPRATIWQIEQMYAVINYRYLNHKPILVSSELTVDEIVNVDEALGTRIYQMCQNYTVAIKGDRNILNYRLAGAKYVSNL